MEKARHHPRHFLPVGIQPSLSIDAESLRTVSVGVCAAGGPFWIKIANGVSIFSALLYPSSTPGFPTFLRLVMLVCQSFPVHNYYAPRSWFQRDFQNQPHAVSESVLPHKLVGSGVKAQLKAELDTLFKVSLYQVPHCCSSPPQADGSNPREPLRSP